MPSGQVALVFEDKAELLRCLDIASEYNLYCKVAPWSIVVVPTTLAKICEKRGVRIARTLRVPTQEEIDEQPPKPLSDETIALTKRMAQDAGEIPRDR